MLLDKLDWMLMEELEDDARQPVMALARKLGTNRETVRFRLNRLRAERILIISCMVNPELLGYQFPLQIGINVSPDKAEAVANQLAALPDVRVVSLVAGPYSILAMVILRDRSALEHFVSEKLAGISDIADIEIMHAYKWVKEAWRYFKPQTDTIFRYPRYNPSDLDLAIVKAMELDPRQTITKLARTVGCSKPAAKARLERLLDEGIIRIVSVVDTTSLGYRTKVGILIKVKPDKINAVARELEAQDTVRHVSLVTGQWQIFAWAQLPDSGNMYNFCSEKLTKIPGIVRFEIVHLGKIISTPSALFDSAQTPPTA